VTGVGRQIEYDLLDKNMTDWWFEVIEYGWRRPPYSVTSGGAKVATVNYNKLYSPKSVAQIHIYNN